MNMVKLPRSALSNDFPYIGHLIQLRLYSNKSKDIEEMRLKEIARIKKEISFDNPPTFCCGMGCADCVYVIWAQELIKKMDNDGPAIALKVMGKVHDPNLKAFLAHEFRMRGFIKK